jgi:hypothetical protein
VFRVCEGVFLISISIRGNPCDPWDDRIALRFWMWLKYRVTEV